MNTNTTTTTRAKTIPEAVEEFEEFYSMLGDAQDVRIRIDGAGRNTNGEIVIVAFDTDFEQHIVATFTLDGNLTVAPLYESKWR